ncbi:MAG: AI-2E family transporter [Candidatus Marinimicrobia bacterium]|nr:AI-2E family transporter [Candidatus Neomarinimicrobiota bacterium]MCF7828877.1 AI-2E family transporter [Candidatus Neomarinimicrobiota bacterium]MCF7880795.1 AI-2E family transporter [Candidatus Neomarinimicrobiota bacterium]
MKREYLVLPILLGLAGVIAFLFYMIWRPFFAPISWAAVFAILFTPLNNRLTAKVPWRSLSATIMTLLVILIIVVPMSLLSILLVAEIVQTYDLVQQWFNTGRYGEILQFFQGPVFVDIREQVNDVIDLNSIDLFSIVSSVMQRLSSFAVSQVTGIVQNFSKTLFSFVLMVFTLFYFFKDGERIVQFLRDIIPLGQKQRDEIVSRFSEVITATVLGDLVVALFQGFLGGIAFWILGLPSPIFWGAVMAFLSIFPVVGAPIVYLPASGILLAQGEFGKGILLLIWGTLMVSQIDNFLRPVLISGRTKLHTLVLFFSILGGIYLFGFLGLIMGPVVAALFLTMVKIYHEELDFNSRPVDSDTPAETGQS